MAEPLRTPVRRASGDPARTELPPMTQGVRLQKILADAGVASRRAAERLITGGAVTVNGRVVTELGARANPRADDVRVDGRRIGGHEPFVYLAMHKPAGYLTTAHDERGRPTVLDLLPKDLPQRVYPVGRLDLNSEGLLLLTNDGELAARLTHPRYGVEKEYQVLVSPELVPVSDPRHALEQEHHIRLGHWPDEEILASLRSGVMVEGRMTAPAKVRRLDPGRGGAWLDISLHEGRKRQVRLMCAAVGLRVQALVRVRFGPITLDRLSVGKTRRLRPEEVRALRKAVGW